MKNHMVKIHRISLRVMQYYIMLLLCVLISAVVLVSGCTRDELQHNDEPEVETLQNEPAEEVTPSTPPPVDELPMDELPADDDGDNEPTMPVNPPDYNTFKNYLVSPVPLTITNDFFVLEIPANVPYSKDIEKRILEYYNWVQTATDLSFHPPGSSFDKVVIDNTDPNTSGGETGVSAHAMDYNLGTVGSEIIYFHEFTKTIQYRTVRIDHKPFVDGFAILTCAKISKEKGFDFNYWYTMQYNYANTDGQIPEQEILADFEHWYRTSDNLWESPVFGLRFAVYLEDRYGDGIHSKLIRDYAAKMGDRISTRDEFVDFLIKQTGNDVFTEFVTWYEYNQALFKEIRPLLFGRRVVRPMPFILSDHDYQDFIWGSNYELNKDDVIIFDFFDSHAFAKFHGFDIVGIGAVFVFSDRATITSYDLHGNLLQTDTYAASDDYLNLSFPNASTLVISDYEGQFWFYPVFGDCYKFAQ